jgi:hypothetical protein
MYSLLYVDDIILTTLSDSLCQHFMAQLAQELAMKYLSKLSYFLGVSAK